MYTAIEMDFFKEFSNLSEKLLLSLKLTDKEKERYKYLHRVFGDENFRKSEIERLSLNNI